MNSAQQWAPVTGWAVAFALGFTAYIGWGTLMHDGWVPLLDDANFAVHEAGHPLFGVFGSRTGLYGGTLAQLLFPLICMIEFARRRWAFSYGLCMIWFGESLLNVARYMADARTMWLPLAGFSAHPLHDWNLILARWGLLNYDVMLANAVRVFACIVIAYALLFLALRWREDVSS